MTGINRQTCICSSCGHKHALGAREIGLYKGMVTALWEIMHWCESKGRHEFDIKEVKHLMGKNEYARFGDWKLFGGLVYSPSSIDGIRQGKGQYGLNLERCREFFAGKRMIPQVVHKNPATGEITPGKHAYAHQIPSLLKFLDQNAQYIAIYQNPIPQPALL